MNRKTFLVPVFPGTNCEKETLVWLAKNFACDAAYLDLSVHESMGPESVAAVVVPGGFSYGDYLRAGALAARSPQMEIVKRLANSGIPVLGICNGFQILCESGLLPGALLPNLSKQHIHGPVRLKLKDWSEISTSEPKECVWLPPRRSAFAAAEQMFASIRIPISCGMGRYLPPLNKKVRVTARYLENLPGSTEDIAAVANDSGNIMGIMPHPERASSFVQGNMEGLVFLWALAVHKGLPIKPQSPLAEFAAAASHFEGL